MRPIGTLTWGVAYLATLVAMVAIDFIWLTLMSDRLYRPVLEPLLAANFAPVPAVLFYLFYIGGLTFLAVAPALRANRLSLATLNGAVLGFTAYATYDLTNQATLKAWSTTLTVADLAWGTILSGIAATIGAAVARRFLR